MGIVEKKLERIGVLIALADWISVRCKRAAAPEVLHSLRIHWQFLSIHWFQSVHIAVFCASFPFSVHTLINRAYFPPNRAYFALTVHILL